MQSITSYTHALTRPQAEKLRLVLQDRGFEFLEKPYTIYAARKEKLNIAVYEKGPKVLIQGKGTQEFVQFHLEPEVLGVAELGYEEVLNPEHFEPHIGVDESGKGDFFGPLVVAGVFVDAKIARTLMDSGVQDSKRITSDAKIRELARTIREIPGCATRVLLISPVKYNVLVKKMRNVNRLLAWGHAKIIEELLGARPDCPRALSDQFGDPKLIEGMLMEKGRTIKLEQRTKAESDPAVAAASILAREKFIDWMSQTSKTVGITIPRGASAGVKAIAQSIVEKSGAAHLETLVKSHFRTAWEVAPDYFPKPPPKKEWKKS